MHGTGTVVLFLGLLVFIAHLFASIFNRTKIPDVLVLIIIGLCLGPFFRIISPSHFGAIGPVFSTLTLVIILFEGGIGLKLETLKRTFREAFWLTLVNLGLAMTIVTVTVIHFTDLDPVRALMLGVIVGGTSPAIVFPLVKQLKMRNESRTILLLESSISEVFCIIIAIALLEAHKLGTLRVWQMSMQIIVSFIVAAILGSVSAFVWSVLLNRIRSIHNAIFATPAFVFIIFGLVEMMGYSGGIAAFVFGVTLENVEFIKIPLLKELFEIEPIALNEMEKSFFAETVFLLRTYFFVYLGLSIQLTERVPMYLGLGLTAVLYLFRIPAVRIAIDRTTPKEDVSLMAVMVPKGLVTAVLASIPLQQGIEGGALIQNITYSVVMFSILFTSIIILLLDKTGLSKLYHWMFAGFGIPVPARENQ